MTLTGTAERAKELTVRMVRAASVSESGGEQGFPDGLVELLREMPYFQAHPQDVWVERIENDPLGRRNVYALVRGNGAKSVVLTGHYDVVDVRNYGPHVDVAFDPDALLPRLIDDLRVNARSEAEHRALVTGLHPALRATLGTLPATLRILLLEDSDLDAELLGAGHEVTGVVAEAGDAGEALALAADLRPYLEVPTDAAGPVFDAWGTVDYERGRLGYPTGPLRNTSGGQVMEFEGGRITVSGGRAEIS